MAVRQRCTTKFQVRTLHLLLTILDLIHSEDLPQPWINVSEPLRLGKVVDMCCHAESSTFGEPVVTFSIWPNNDEQENNVPVSMFGLTMTQCYCITVTTRHHGSSAECHAKYPSGRGRSAVPFPFVVMELSQPVITGPRSLPSGGEGEHACTVQDVTYDTHVEFSLTWRVNGFPNENDKQKTVNRGYLDTFKSRLALHCVKSCINIRAPVNHGNTPTTLLLECVVFHVGLGKFGKQIIISYNVTIQPDPTTTTTTTTTTAASARGELDGGGGGGGQTTSDQPTSESSATPGFFVTQSRAPSTTSIATFNRKPELSRSESNNLWSLMMVVVLSSLLGLALLIFGGIILVRCAERRIRRASKDSMSRRPSFVQLNKAGGNQLTSAGNINPMAAGGNQLTSAGNINSMAAGGRQLSFTFGLPPSAQPYAASAPSEYIDWKSSQYTSDSPPSEVDASSYDSSVESASTTQA